MMLISPEFESQIKIKLNYLMTDNQAVQEIDALAKGFYQYEIEKEALNFINANPRASLKELWEFFDQAAPDGLPTCASEWEDDEED
mgnify:CR=1 FL=1